MSAASDSMLRPKQRARGPRAVWAIWALVCTPAERRARVLFLFAPSWRRMSSSSGDDGQASDAFNDDDDELRVKRRGASIRRSSLEMPAAGGTSSSREAATDKPSQLLGGTPLDHDEDTLSHLMGVMRMRLLMAGEAVS